MLVPVRLILLSLLLLAFTSARSQDYRDSTATEREKPPQQPRPWKDRIWFGGAIGLSFGSITNIAIEPMVGYKITRNGKLSAGIGITYQYFRDNRAPAYETNVYGGRIFGRYRILQPLFAHVEYNQLNYEFYDRYMNAYYRRWVPYLLVGGGYSAQMGSSNTYLVAMVLFDVIQDAYSPYSSGEPWISIGVGVGF